MTTLTKDGLQKVLIRIYEQGSELGDNIKTLNVKLEKLENTMNKRLDKLDEKYDDIYDKVVTLQKDVQKLSSVGEYNGIDEPITSEFSALLKNIGKGTLEQGKSTNEKSTTKRRRQNDIIVPATSVNTPGLKHKINKSTTNKESSTPDSADSADSEKDEPDDVCKICFSRDPKTTKKPRHRGHHIRGPK
eukprot:CAMPEP_0204823714 /NCGR_PEP_ID=MMETSP1346-20131115/1798_1 /ASSEMBLY_ACC=CAM_ASM_000771 /TAXON_ID=215587 /ORGANISM="Aplanochytrium stocchinoi, Strain GSBS06" /LENGTH=188 /DNA_ID=CAMNT_0051950485 /DNA_START=359 /DNA_END=925 /DNA_ORIENTATION=+